MMTRDFKSVTESDKFSQMKTNVASVFSGIVAGITRRSLSESKTALTRFFENISPSYS